VMDIDNNMRREKMIKLRDELLAVEEDRLAGHAGVTPDELETYLDGILDDERSAEEIIMDIRRQHGTTRRFQETL